MGTADGISLPSASAPVEKRTSVLVIFGDYDYSSGLIAPGRVLTFNDAGLRQRSLSSRRLGLCLRGGSGLLSRRCGFFFRHLCNRFIPLPGQVRRFPAEYTSRLSIKYDYHIQVLLGKDQYLKARPDHRHGWGAEDTGDVDQSRLGRRLLLRLCSRCSFSSSSGGFCAPLSDRGLALHLRQELFYGGGWATTTPSCLPHRVPVAFVALLNGLGRRHLLQARKLHRQHTNSRHQYSTTFFKMAYLSGCGLRDLQ
jgi:hypothetical protein